MGLLDNLVALSFDLVLSKLDTESHIIFSPIFFFYLAYYINLASTATTLTELEPEVALIKELI